MRKKTKTVPKRRRRRVATFRWLYRWHEGWRLHPMRMTEAEAARCGQELKIVETSEMEELR